MTSNAVLQVRERIQGQLWPALARTMRTGGYYDRILGSGPELDRVKRFIQAIAGDVAVDPPQVFDRSGRPQPAPWVLPMFPSLGHRPFRERSDHAWVPDLETAFETVRADAIECEQIRQPNPYGDHVRSGGEWWLGLMAYCGSDAAALGLHSHAPRTRALIASLPRCAALSFPLTDIVFSAHTPGTQVLPHTSTDNLRVRAHLPLVVPPGDCAIRVGDETRGWKQGEVLLLEDSFLHCAWNNTDRTRTVLILDFWHPDLTDVEIEALSAGFMKSQVRRLLLATRGFLPPGRVPDVVARFRDEDRGNPVLARYWDREPEDCSWDGLPIVTTAPGPEKS